MGYRYRAAIFINLEDDDMIDNRGNHVTWAVVNLHERYQADRAKT